MAIYDCQKKEKNRNFTNLFVKLDYYVYRLQKLYYHKAEYV